MIKRDYNSSNQYSYAVYGRMSTKEQNKRSPDQQFASIAETVERAKLPWKLKNTYRDDGISGRYITKRPGFQKMLHDIEIGLIEVDLIVVDTFERIGRSEEIETILRKLHTDYGVLIVSAENNFADPTGVAGKALRFVDQLRATEDGKTKSHHVLRGQKDAARQRHWPGGVVPFGYDLKKNIDERTGEVYSTLHPNIDEAWVLRKFFNKAAETGWGPTRVAKWLNEEPDIPESIGKISQDSIRYRLENQIYIGTLVWNKVATDIVNDARIIEPNPIDEILIIENFCEPIIPKELFETVNNLSDARSNAYWESRQREHGQDEKLIKPLSQGISIKYLLAGMTRCGECGAAMKTQASGSCSHAYCLCSRSRSGLCTNNQSVREDKLRETAVSRLRDRLFPSPKSEGEIPNWFPELAELVEQELGQFTQGEPDRRAAILQEIDQKKEQLTGWLTSLGNPSLETSIRQDIEAQYTFCKTKVEELEYSLQREQALKNHVTSILNPARVTEKLKSLDDLLRSENITLANLELTRHIDRIDCYKDGRVIMRGTLLGLFEGAVELLSHQDNHDKSYKDTSSDVVPVLSRRRANLRINTLTANNDLSVSTNYRSLDPERFSGLSSELMWDEPLFITPTIFWAEKHAIPVGERRLDGLTHEKLADEFGVSVPTIRKALKYAAAKDARFQGTPRKMARPRWHEVYALEVAAKKADGLGTNELVELFNMTDTTIRKALVHAKALARNSNS